MSDDTRRSAPPDPGKTTLDEKMFFEAERLSYQSANAIAADIARCIAETIKDRAVAIVNPSLLVDFANLDALYLALDDISRDYAALAANARKLRGAPKPPDSARIVRETLIRETTPGGAVAGAIGVGVGVVGAAATAGGIGPAIATAAGLVGLLRQDVQYNAARTAVDPLALELALAGKVKSAGATNVFVSDLTALALASHGGIRVRIEQVQTAKMDAWEQVGPLGEALTQLEPLSIALEGVDRQLDALQSQWSQRDPSTGLSVLTRLLRAEAIKASKPAYLHAAVVSSGGFYRVARNLLNLILMRDGVAFSGGCVVRWALLGDDGSVLKGGVATLSMTSSLRRGEFY